MDKKPVCKLVYEFDGKKETWKGDFEDCRKALLKYVDGDKNVFKRLLKKEEVKSV